MIICQIIRRPTTPIMPVSFACETCGKKFNDFKDLTRHRNRKTPCTGAVRPFICECGKACTQATNMHRHRREHHSSSKTAEKTPGPVVINQTTVNQFNSIQANAPGANGNMVMVPVTELHSPEGGQRGTQSVPGWPTRWPVPAVTPNPFSPPGFSLSLEQLTAAVEALPESVREACRRGDQTAVVQLLMGILRRIHADPLERNVYMNPRRSDQALIYIPEHWVTCQLDEAGQAMFRRIAEVLGCLPRQVPPALRTMATAARQSCATSAPELARASRAALSAHLENVRHPSTAGVDWLGLSADEAESLAFFGQEWTAHMQSQVVAAAAEAASQRRLWRSAPDT